MQTELTQPGSLLDEKGRLTQVGWARQSLLDCNLENASFYTLKFLQHFRIKRWDYYAVFTPQRFFSATIADLGYAGNIFVYSLDFTSGDLHEEGAVIPFGNGIILPRDSKSGITEYKNKQMALRFQADFTERRIFVDWPGFDKGRGIKAEIASRCPPEHESMTIVIPIGKDRFYYNCKINNMPASGTIDYGDWHEELQPDKCLASLDWGRGVWEYRSYWNWASASGYLPDGRRFGLNLGRGFGDLSHATENCIILDGRVHKLGDVKFDYRSGDYMRPWKFTDSEGRLDLTFTPFKDRTAVTNLGVIFSEVHQMFGRYSGQARLDDGKEVEIKDLIGFAEEHHARW
jgi:Domain of unknown function (DUF2804), N-terminal/Domain of unknown function (DUF2804), C-terminal